MDNCWLRADLLAFRLCCFKPGFDDMFSSCGKKNMLKCAYVVLCSSDMVKAHMVSEFSIICLVVFA